MLQKKQWFLHLKYQFFLTSGSFTTAHLMVACTEKTLKQKFNTNFEGKNIIVYGGKGIVGGISAIMCAQHGAKCTIVGYDGINNVKKSEEYKSRYNVDIIPGDGSTDELNSSYLPEADIIFVRLEQARKL